MLNTLKTTTRRPEAVAKGDSLPTRVQTACGSWPNLQHVAPHKSGAMNPSNTTTTTTTNSKTITSSSTIVTRNMSIYDYLRQRFSTAKRQREPQPAPALPAPKLRKHNYSNYRWEREREKERQRKEERQRRSGDNASMDDYDIRFFFYLNSLILFTMSCSRQGDDLKHFVCDRIRKFDRLRRKARKRRKRRPKQLQL